MSLYTELRDWYEPIGGIRYRTTKEICWEVGRKGSDLWVIVPTGYPFDVSIPRFLWWLLDPHDPRFLKAGALHDFLLHDALWDRVSSAAAFSDSLRAEKVGRFKRLMMVFAVIAWKWR
ncbi:hypothetical protein NBRC116590_09500 [Pelagimonas sp. KU-00592-HH]|uniref:DUF1353 domain-containing protein n=1 Tax=Pelagimonas sp. KU-00592-HH TaxID=3127651 RepID=UPI0031036561